MSQIGHVNVGFILKTDNNISPWIINIETNDSAKTFFKKMLALSNIQDRRTIGFRNYAIKTYGRYLGYTVALSTMKNYTKDVLTLAENNYWSLIGMTTTLLDQNLRYIPIAEKYLKKAKLLADDQRSKFDVAKEFYLEGLIAKKKGNSRKAKNLFRKSIKIDSKKNNRSYNALKEL